ncbi:MAG: formate dehydrogenase accessory sulfurtransferase FdhD [Phycisphaerae bacterium]
MPDNTPSRSLPPGSVDVPITRVTGDESRPTRDSLAIEEPLEIRLSFGPHMNRTLKPISITMRTPGPSPEDFELALGFLFTEGIIRSLEQVERYYYCGPETGGLLHLHNVVRIELHPSVQLDLTRLERHFYTTSSCGVCGKTSINALRAACPQPLADNFTIPSDMIHALPEFLRAAQSVFDRTGGLHASALFDSHGKLLAMREDVGRHNALDKLVGRQLMAGAVPVQDKILLVSGRASFELLQKALMARIPVLAAVGAPSSLAVQLANEFNITLLGFVRNNRFNVYSAPNRVAAAAAVHF